MRRLHVRLRHAGEPAMGDAGDRPWDHRRPVAARGPARTSPCSEARWGRRWARSGSQVTSPRRSGCPVIGTTARRGAHTGGGSSQPAPDGDVFVRNVHARALPPDQPDHGPLCGGRRTRRPITGFIFMVKEPLRSSPGPDVIKTVTGEEVVSRAGGAMSHNTEVGRRDFASEDQGRSGRTAATSTWNPPAAEQRSDRLWCC